MGEMVTYHHQIRNTEEPENILRHHERFSDSSVLVTGDAAVRVASVVSGVPVTLSWLPGDDSEADGSSGILEVRAATIRLISANSFALICNSPLKNSTSFSRRVVSCDRLLDVSLAGSEWSATGWCLSNKTNSFRPTFTLSRVPLLTR